MVTLLWRRQKKIAVSALCGAAVALWAFLYLRHERRELEKSYSMTTVLRAKKYIAEGKLIGPDLVEEAAVPVAYLQPSAFRGKRELLDPAGGGRFKARIGILKGEQLTKSKLEEPGAYTGLAWALPPGQTAMSLRLNPEQAVAGFIRPGDWVNVYCTVDRGPGWPADETFLLLPRVKCLAAGENFKSVESGPLLVTLMVTPPQAALVALAADKGRLTLALGSAVEAEMPRRSAVRLQDLRTGKWP